MVGRKRIILFLSLFLGCALIGESTEKYPWTGNPFEFELRGATRFQHYRQVSSGGHLKSYPSDDFFVDASLRNNLALLLPVNIELEIREAFTRKQDGNIDSCKLTTIYPFRDDVAGDPLSVHFGLSYDQAFMASLHDISSFHHGLYNGELFVSIGKEKSFLTFWRHRWWVVLGLGEAERGSSWGRIDIHADFSFIEKHQLKFFVNCLWGMGHKNLHIHAFEGYGNVAHSSIDVGLGYTYQIDYFGEFAIEYSLRPYATNFPAYVQQGVIKILYTFGL